MLMLKKIALAAGAILISTAISGATYAAEVKKGGTLRVASISKWRTLNPAVQSGSATGLPGSQIFAGLVRVDKNFVSQPYLATSWKISDDAKTYTFKLNKAAKFHDGKPITSSDVAFSLGVVKKNHPFGPVMFGAVTAVETPDANTAVFKLANPTPSLMASLQPLLLPILPKHIYDDGQDMKTHPRNNKDVVGSGPFIVAENKPGESIVLNKNPNFFLEGRPYLDKIVIQASRDAASQVLAMDRGELDFYPFAFFAPHDVKRLSKNKGIFVTYEGNEALGGIRYFEYNLRKKPFNDLRVRQAIAFAIDDEKHSQLLGAGGVPSASIIHSGSPYHSKDVPSYPTDLKKAKALLDEAGYKPDANGIRFSFTLDMPTYAKPQMKVTSEYLKARLKEVGIDVKLRRSPDFGTWVKRVSSWEYEATINGIWGYSDPVIGVHRLFVCENIRHVIWTNTEGYCNEEVDKTLASAGSSMDDNVRRAKYAKFQKIVKKELPIYPMYESTYTTIHHKYVKNVPIRGWGALTPWDEIYLDK
jgi:peptide/nickel transport system substrate-binding protein